MLNLRGVDLDLKSAIGGIVTESVAANLNLRELHEGGSLPSIGIVLLLDLNTLHPCSTSLCKVLGLLGFYLQCNGLCL